MSINSLQSPGWNRARWRDLGKPPSARIPPCCTAPPSVPCRPSSGSAASCTPRTRFSVKGDFLLVTRCTFSVVLIDYADLL